MPCTANQILKPFPFVKGGIIHNRVKKYNPEINKTCICVEDIFGDLKVFRILTDRNRSKKLGLRFNLIAGIYNLELLKNDF